VLNLRLVLRFEIAFSNFLLPAKLFREPHMTPNDFRRIALALPGAEEGSHMGHADFRVDGRIFATLASQSQGYGNLMLTPEQQQLFVADLPDIFLPIPGGWGRMGSTHIRLSVVSEDVLSGALRTAWQIRVDKNAKFGKPRKPGKPHKSTVRSKANSKTKSPRK
jgi:hypothetical protein